MSFKLYVLRYEILFTIHDSRCHSVLKLFAGFANAALIAWKLTVNNVITTDATITNAKTPTPILILY